VTASETLGVFLERARIAIDQALDLSLPVPPACPVIVSEAMRYSVFAGGKRLRPVLTLAAAGAVERRGGTPEAARYLDGLAAGQSVAAGGGLSRAMAAATPAACAIEMLHTYSLIHDDLPAMDNDTLRRGRPTLHVVYGDGIAILAGDEPAGSDPALAARKLRVLELIGNAAGAMGMVGGQAMDLQAAGQAPGHPLVLDADALRAMHARKTGALIRASAVSGAIMAGGTDDVVGWIDRYAADLGLAFQIVDDILDVEGDAAQLGKTAGKDAADRKATYPSLFGLERSRRLAAECVARATQTLADAQLTDGWLSAIADWVVSRRN
jgi:geranylgeranyl diphosphate synthase type II